MRVCYVYTGHEWCQGLTLSGQDHGVAAVSVVTPGSADDMPVLLGKASRLQTLRGTQERDAWAGLHSSAVDHTSGPLLQTRGNPGDYSRVYWCTCTLSSNPVYIAHVIGDAAPGLCGPGNVASRSYRQQRYSPGDQQRRTLASLCRTEGGKAAEGSAASFRSSPNTERRKVVPHRKGSSTHKKTPTGNSWGQPIQAVIPFPRKDVSAPCRVGLLVRGTYLLSAPSQGLAPQWLSWSVMGARL
jgi:hypothetical protein